MEVKILNCQLKILFYSWDQVSWVFINMVFPTCRSNFLFTSRRIRGTFRRACRQPDGKRFFPALHKWQKICSENSLVKYFSQNSQAIQTRQLNQRQTQPLQILSRKNLAKPWIEPGTLEFSALHPKNWAIGARQNDQPRLCVRIIPYKQFIV